MRRALYTVLCFPMPCPAEKGQCSLSPLRPGLRLHTSTHLSTHPRTRTARPTPPVPHFLSYWCEQSDASIGLALMDRFTSSVLDFFQAAFAKEQSRGWASISAIRGTPGAQQTTSLQKSVSVGRFAQLRSDIRRVRDVG